MSSDTNQENETVAEQITMTRDVAQALRRPFPANAIGVLPKPRFKHAEKGNCQECGGYHGMPAVHLDYVGHAAVTDRLLSIDPAWTWEPLAYDERGLPAIDRQGNLWIKLTVAGVTRLGVGDGASLKEMIGDAIRNAAMRFGVALDLWSKEELESAATEEVYKPTRDLAEAPAEGPTTEPAPDGAMVDTVMAALEQASTSDAVRELYRRFGVGRAPDEIKEAFSRRAEQLAQTEKGAEQ